MVEASLDGLSFSCGSQLNEVDFDLPEDLLSIVFVRDLLSIVFVRDLQCSDPVEVLYYSGDNVDICVHCCTDIDTETNTTPKEYYPQCEDCVDKDKIKRKNTKK